MTQTSISHQPISILAELKKLTYTTPQNLKRIEELAQQFLARYFNEENIALLGWTLRRIRDELAKKNIPNLYYPNLVSEGGSLNVIGALFETAVSNNLKKHHQNIYNAIKTADLAPSEKQKALDTLLTHPYSLDESTVTHASLESATRCMTTIQYANSIIETKKLVRKYATDTTLSRETTVWEKLSRFIDDLFNPAIKLKDLFSEEVVAARSRVNMFAATEKKVSKEVEAIKQSKSIPARVF